MHVHPSAKVFRRFLKQDCTSLNQISDLDSKDAAWLCSFFLFFKDEREKRKLIYWIYYASVSVEHAVTINLCHH